MAIRVPLSIAELRRAVGTLSHVLNQEMVKYGIIGGAACSLIGQQHQRPYRATEDIDLIIQPDLDRGIYAYKLSEKLYTDYPQYFVKEVCEFGVVLPAVRITRDNGNEIHVVVEMFDIEAWPRRTQYDLSKPDNDRINITLDDTTTSVFSPRWLLREKIVSQYQREGSAKEITDLRDIENLLPLVQPKCLTFTTEDQVKALTNLLGKRPEWKEVLKTAIECPEVFN